MSRAEIETILKQVEQLLAAAGTLPAEAEQAVEKLLNVVEALSSYSQGLAAEVERLRQDLEKKKKAKKNPRKRKKRNNNKAVLNRLFFALNWKSLPNNIKQILFKYKKILNLRIKYHFHKFHN